MKDAIASGIDGYDDDVKKSVRKAAHGLRLTREAAMSIASSAVSIQSDRFPRPHPPSSSFPLFFCFCSFV